MKYELTNVVPIGKKGKPLLNEVVIKKEEVIDFYKQIQADKEINGFVLGLKRR